MNIIFVIFCLLALAQAAPQDPDPPAPDPPPDAPPDADPPAPDPANPANPDPANPDPANPDPANPDEPKPDEKEGQDNNTLNEDVKRPPTKPNCMCLTRGPLPRFKLIGNLHFKGIKHPKKRFSTTENPDQTLCPPCNCADCFTTELTTEKPNKPPCKR